MTCPACHGTGVSCGVPSLPGMNSDCFWCSGSGEVAEIPKPPQPAPTAPPVDVPLFISEEEAAQLDEASGWQPSIDQSEGLQTLLSAFLLPGPYVLDGCAGTGKTTLVKALLRRLTPEWEVVLVAPTWRAANRLREVTGKPTTSIHAVIYGAPVQRRRCSCGEWSHDLMKPRQVHVYLDASGDLKVAEDQEQPPSGSFELPRYYCPTCKSYHEDATRFPQRLDFDLADAGGQTPGRFRLIVVDEVGMVPPRVRRDIRRTFEDDRTRVLGVGDQNQLSWVVEGGQPEEDEPYLSLAHPTVSLTRVHRQSEGDPALRLAQDLKVHPEQSGVKWPYPLRVPGVSIFPKVLLQDPAAWAARLRCANEDLALITFSNKTRAELNAWVRHATGAGTLGVLIPGDRLLARSNTVNCGVFNGELFDLCDVQPVQNALLREDGRIHRKRYTYEHDRILEAGVVVLSMTLARVGDSNHTRFSALMVSPRGRGGQPELESDLILAGMLSGDARQRCREITRAWAEEYALGVEERQAEFEMRRSHAEGKKIAEAKFKRASSPREISAALKSLRRCGADDRLVDEVEREAAAGVFTGAETREGVFARFATPYDVASECADVQDYCARVYGAVDPKHACTLDRGEALTCHAMQGSQAKYVGVVFDGPFWGAWKNDRVGALRWAYTAITRSAGNLALFSIRREP